MTDLWVVRLEVVTLYRLRMSTRDEVQQIFIPEEENLNRNKLVVGVLDKHRLGLL